MSFLVEIQLPVSGEEFVRKVAAANNWPEFVRVPVEEGVAIKFVFAGVDQSAADRIREEAPKGMGYSVASQRFDPSQRKVAVPSVSFEVRG